MTRTELMAEWLVDFIQSKSLGSQLVPLLCWGCILIVAAGFVPRECSDRGAGTLTRVILLRNKERTVVYRRFECADHSMREESVRTWPLDKFILDDFAAATNAVKHRIQP